jgi:hypothetical protein
MTHRLRFVPLLLILAGVAVGLAIQPSEAPAQTDSAEAAPASRGDARTQGQAVTALRVARRARKIARRGVAQANAVLATAEQAQTAAAQAQTAAANAATDAAQALTDAAQAQNDAADAAADATQALTDAAQAQTEAEAATERLDAAAVVSDFDPGAVTTAEETDYVDLGGPAVTVDVPASGLVEIWASVRFDDPSDGQVALYEDGQRVPIPGQELICAPNGTIGDVLISFAGGPGSAQTMSTPPTPIFGFGCGTAGGVPGSMLFERTPGAHTYELRYADCGCDGGTASFSERLLRAAGRE